jgi:hypothetical protein
MWRVIFKELWGLTNSKGLELNPIELNMLYEKLYDVGKLLQTEKALMVFEPSFRAWLHIFQNNGRSRKFYKTIEKIRGRHGLASLFPRTRGRNEVHDYAACCLEPVWQRNRRLVRIHHERFRKCLKQTGYCKRKGLTIGNWNGRLKCSVTTMPPSSLSLFSGSRSECILPFRSRI